MPTETPTRRSRRQILAAGLGALGGLFAGALGRPLPAEAAANGNVQLSTGVGNTDNDSAAETRVNATTTGIVALSGVSGLGTGLYGYSATGTAGVRGLGGDTAPGVLAESTNGTGLSGASTNTVPNADNFANPGHRTGVVGSVGDTSGIEANTDEIGVYGYADLSISSIAVRGKTHQGAGVFGSSDTGIGMFGSGDIGLYATGGSAAVVGDVGPTAIGVYGWVGTTIAPAAPGGVAVQAAAQTTSQVALNVVGKAKFSRSGRASLAKGHASKAVSMAGVTTSSYVIATVQTNNASVYVRAVVPASGKFTIYLSKAPTATVYVGYLVVN